MEEFIRHWWFYPPLLLYPQCTCQHSFKGKWYQCYEKIVLTFEVLESAFAKSPGVHLDSRGSGSHILGTAALEAKYGFHSNWSLNFCVCHIFQLLTIGWHQWRDLEVNPEFSQTNMYWSVKRDSELRLIPSGLYVLIFPKLCCVVVSQNHVRGLMMGHMAPLTHEWGRLPVRDGAQAPNTHFTSIQCMLSGAGRKGRRRTKSVILYYGIYQENMNN